MIIVGPCLRLLRPQCLLLPPVSVLLSYVFQEIHFTQIFKCVGLEYFWFPHLLTLWGAALSHPTAGTVCPLRLSAAVLPEVRYLISLFQRAACAYCNEGFPSLSSLITRMLQRDPKKRASLEEIENHPWLQGVDPSPATKYNIPLVSYKNLSEEEHNSIIQRMVLGDIADRDAIVEYVAPPPTVCPLGLWNGPSVLARGLVVGGGPSCQGSVICL